MTNPIAALTVDEKGVVTGVSAAALAMLESRPDNAIGSTLDELLHNSHGVDLCVARIALEPISGTTAGHVVILEPCQAQTLQPDHDEALLRLAAGIAHDFDNLLTIVSGHLQMAESRVAAAARHDHIRQSRLACAMASRMTRRLRTFARRQPLDSQLHDINALVRPVAEMLGQALQERRTFGCELEPNVPPVMIDRSEFENALLNLLLNSMDATKVGDTITIATRYDAGDAGPGHALLIVTDSGSGMCAQVAERAFEPFYSTKPPDRGSGLGLATVAGFTRQSGGTVELSTVLGTGTSITLRFPVHQDGRGPI